MSNLILSYLIYLIYLSNLSYLSYLSILFIVSIYLSYLSYLSIYPIYPIYLSILFILSIYLSYLSYLSIYPIYPIYLSILFILSILSISPILPYLSEDHLTISEASLVVTNAIFIGVEVQDNLHNPNGDSLVLKARVSPSHLAVAGCGGGVCGAGDLGVQNSWNIPQLKL